MKFGHDKGELRIRRSHYGPLEWSLTGPPPGTVKKFRRWNLVLIAFLLFLVLGVFVVAEAPRTESNTNASLNENASPSSVQHTNSSKSALPPIHSRESSGNPNKVTNGHHTG